MQPTQGSLSESPQDFAQRNQLTFRDISYLSRALTHRSYMNENNDAMEDNERLEFLGDAVLDFLVAAWLYNRFPEMKEGVLTSYRSALVGAPQLAAFGRMWDVGRAMRLGRGEDEGGGRKRERLLCSTFEAIIGALYLDSGLETVKNIVYPMLEPAMNQIVADNNDQDPKSRLQEWSQSHGLGIPHYRQISVSGPDHDRIFEFEVTINGNGYGRGTGTSKHAASKDAARNALISLGLDV
ncbi:MAG: ribonuclease III [Anaerolineales bacterium]